MAETQAGGIYRVGGKLVDAEGKEAKQEKQPEQEGGSEPETYPYADLYAAGGFKDWEAVSAAKDEDLLKVDGIGPSRLQETRAYKP